MSIGYTSLDTEGNNHTKSEVMQEHKLILRKVTNS